MRWCSRIAGRACSLPPGACWRWPNKRAPAIRCCPTSGASSSTPLYSNTTQYALLPAVAWGETPLALVVKTPPESTLTQPEFLQWAYAHLGKLQRLSAPELRDELPRSAIGKLLKRELREPYWQQQGKHIA